MRKFLLGLMICLLLAPAGVMAAAQVESPDECKYCGMNRTTFGHSRMVVTYTDGSSTGTCSINCILIDMNESKGKTVKSFQVGDYNSRKLIDAKKAVWVIGGRKNGVMTPVAKWGFEQKKAAQSFIKANGGKIGTFDDVLAMTRKELVPEEKSEKGHSGNQ